MPIACSKSFINHYTRGISWLLKCQEKAGCPMCRVAGVRRWRRKATWPMTSDLRCSITTPSDLIISISKDFFSSINGSFVLWVPRIVKVWVLFGHFRAFLVFVGTFWFCLGLFICTIWNIWLTFVIWCTLWFCLVLIGSVWYFLVLFGTFLCFLALCATLRFLTGIAQRDKSGLYWNMFVWGTIGTVHELIARLTEQFFQHPVTKLMIFPKQPSREVHLESTTELQIIYFPSHNWQTHFTDNISWPFIWHYLCQSLPVIYPYHRYGCTKKRGKV